jgi:class 3 adenylate cyclase/CHASE2 domain-containing sensor protein
MSDGASGRAVQAGRGKRTAAALQFVGVALLAAVLAALATEKLSFFARVDQFVQDWEIASVFAPREEQDPEIVIVAIDEETLRGFAYRSPVDRKFVSDLLQRLAAHQPKAIGLDLLLDQPTEPDKDAALRETLRTAKVPVIVSYIVSEPTVTPEQKAYEDAMVPPRQRALADLPTDQFDTARTVFPGQRMDDGRYVMGFARALAAAAGVRTPDVEVPIIWRGRPPPTPTDLNPKPFRQWSATVAGFMPAAWFKDKIVLIGSDVTLVDRHRTPFSVTQAGEGGQLPGVVIQAHILSQLLHQKPSPLVGWQTNFAIVLFFALAGAALGVADLALVPRIAIGAGLVLLLWAGGIALFHYQGVMIGLIAPPIAFAVAFSVLDSLLGRDARRQREFIQGAFSRYVSPKVVEQMVEDPSRMSLEGERRLMTYLFTDIQNFTTMSEKMESKVLAHLLNAYLDGMTNIVLKYDGMVDKFIGDAVFAIFNAPVDLPDHAQKAVLCALEMDRFTESFRAEQNKVGIPLGVTRIGVHTGASVIGNFGSKARFTYTAQGDAVNTAARLEGINKYLGTRLCVSGATRERCPDVAFRPIASAVLKGKTEALELWEPLHEGTYSPDFLRDYGEAYERLRTRQSDAADLFAALHAAAPDDPCVALHMQRLAEGEAGVEMVMTEK